MNKEVQILIAPDRMIRLFAEPRDLFAVVSSLKQNCYDPQLRIFDEELNDWTCWQPTTIPATVPTPKRSRRKSV